MKGNDFINICYASDIIDFIIISIFVKKIGIIYLSYDSTM